MVNYSTNALIISILVLVAVIPIAGFGFYSMYNEQSIDEERELEFMRSILKLEKDRIDTYFSERLSDITIVSKIPSIQNNLHVLFQDSNDADHDTIELIHSQFSSILKIYGYETIWVVDNDFQTKFVVGKNEGEKKPLDSSHFEHDLIQMKKGVYLSDVYPGNFGAPSELFVSVPIIVDNIQLGYVLYDVDLETYFKDTLFELKSSETGEMVFVQYQHGETFFIKELRFDDSPPFSKPISSDIARSMPALDSAIGVSGFGFSTDYRGEPVLAAWDYVPLTRWGIVAKIDSSEAFINLENNQRNIVIIVIGLTVFSFTMGLALSRNLIRPMIFLNNASSKIAKKDYDVEMPSTGTTEQKLIAITFNEMIKSLKANEKLTRQHLDELKKIDIQKGEFAAMASHELKTPLVPIKGYLEMLLEPELIGTLSPKQNEIINKILESTEVMETLILKLLTVQRLDLGEMKWSISEFDLLDLMDDVYSNNQSLMSPKKIDFINHTKDSKIISSDYNQIKEIFSNLIVNSVDFVSVGGKIDVDGKIAVSGNIDDGNIVFSVKDNGVGISKENQKGLFKKFYQADTSVTRKHGGTGLGLAICKGLSEGLGGKIWIESEKGQGCSVYFSIPLVFKK